MQVPAERTAVPVSAGPYRSEGGASHPPRPALRSAHRVVSIGLWSVAKVSLVFYLVVGVSLVTAGVALSVASSSTGLTSHIQHLGHTLFGARSLPLGPAPVAAVSAGAAAALALAGTAVNVIAALVYNRIADLVGGIRWRAGDPDI